MLKSPQAPDSERKPTHLELSLLLIKQIVSMFLIMSIGFISMKTKLVKPSDGKVLSAVVLYVSAPCMILSSFQMEYSNDKLTGLLFTTAAALAVHVIFIALGTLLKRPLKLNGMEQASVIYPNAVNLIVPIVIAVLGREYVFYCSGYMIVQTILMWTHGKSLVREEHSWDLKKIVFNINVIALAAGLCLFLFRIRLPDVINGAIESVSDTMGPLTMLVIGMLLGEMGFSKIITDKRAYLVCLIRLLVFPIIIVLISGITGVIGLHPDGRNIMLISVLSASSAAAAMITQFAQIYDKQPGHAGVINVMSVLMCVVTMPLMAAIFQYLTG